MSQILFCMEQFVTSPHAKKIKCISCIAKVYSRDNLHGLAYVIYIHTSIIIIVQHLWDVIMSCIQNLKSFLINNLIFN